MRRVPSGERHHGLMMRPLLVLVLAQRLYHVVPLPKVAVSQQTHIETCGQVVYVRKQLDGDWHITLAIGAAKVVAEIIPLIPLEPPPKGAWVTVRGIRRFDDEHKWYEINPVESWVLAAKGCAS